MTSLGRSITETATARPDEPALVFVGDGEPPPTATWRELDRRSNQIARLLADHGLGPGVVPRRWDLPTWERDRVLAVLDPTVLVTEWTDVPCAAVGPADLATADALDDGPLPDRIPNPATGIATGGSTGTP